MEKEFITLENNIEYMIVSEKDNYLFLSNPEDETDMCIRKVVGDEVVGLDDENELESAMRLFIKEV